MARAIELVWQTSRFGTSNIDKWKSEKGNYFSFISVIDYTCNINS